MDTEIKDALKKAAIGYEYKEVRKIIKTHPDGRQTMTEEVTLRHIPPNVSAAQMLERGSESEPKYNSTNSTLHMIRNNYAAG